MPEQQNLNAAPSACMEILRKGDMLVKALGIELLESRPGYGKAMMPLDGRQANSVGIAHGGALFTLADVAMALAANNDGKLALTLSGGISFFRPGEHGPLTAEAHEISGSSKVGHYEVAVTDARGELIANFRGIAYKKEIPLA